MSKHTRRKERYTPTIDRVLDLHGYFAREAVPALGEFLAEAERAGCKRVQVVVGKGTHSTQGPVLPDVVKSYLNSAGYRYTYAKVQEGGEGALVVTL